MDKRIRSLGIFMVLCFVALFVQLNNIQILKAHSLANAPDNPRVLAAARSQSRGSILSSDGITLASSVLAPKGSAYTYQRVYNPSTAKLFSQIVGFDSPAYGNNYGVEAEYNNYLSQHTKTAKTLKDLLTPQTEVDNVTLTVNANLQSQVADALNSAAPGVVGAAAVVLTAGTGGIDAMYSDPTFDPNPLVSQSATTRTKAMKALDAQPGGPLVSGSFGQRYAPGSSFKVVTTSAVLETSPTLAAMTYPSTPPFIVLPDTGNPPQVLTNYHNEACGGTLEQLVIQSCDANFAFIGQQLGAQALVNQAQLYGFNQKLPLDVPADTVATSTFGTVASFAQDLPGLMKSAIGQQNVTASALQMAMVAGTVANGGVEMTPHLMANVRDSQGDLIVKYAPKAWKTSTSPQAAATLTTFMQGVASSGTAANIFPASWNVAAKTGTAETGSLGPFPKFTTDWLIAFVSTTHGKVAVAVVLPNQPAGVTGAEVSGPIVKQILGDVLADQ